MTYQEAVGVRAILYISAFWTVLGLASWVFRRFRRLSLSLIFAMAAPFWLYMLYIPVGLLILREPVDPGLIAVGMAGLAVLAAGPTIVGLWIWRQWNQTKTAPVSEGRL